MGNSRIIPFLSPPTVSCLVLGCTQPSSNCLQSWSLLPHTWHQQQVGEWALASWERSPALLSLGGTKSSNKDLSLPLLSPSSLAVIFPGVEDVPLAESGGALLSAHSPTAPLMGPGCLWEHCQAWGGGSRHHLPLNSHSSARLLLWGCWTGVGGLQGPFHR